MNVHMHKYDDEKTDDVMTAKVDSGVCVCVCVFCEGV